MPIFAVLQAGKSTYGGQPVWYGGLDNPQPFTISNLAVNGNIWIGSNQGVGPNNPNESTPIAPGGFLSFDGTQDVYYVIADAPNVQAIIYPGVVSVFQPGGITFITAPVTNVTEDASTPPVVHQGLGTVGSVTTASFSLPISWLFAILTACDNLATPNLSVTDTGGHTWTLIDTGTNSIGGEHIATTIWRTQLTTAPGSITVTGHNSTASASSDMQLAVRVVNSANASQTGAGHANTNGAATSNIAGNVVTTKAGSLVYVGGTTVNSATSTALSGTTTIEDFDDAGFAELFAGKSTNNTQVPGSTNFGWNANGQALFAWVAAEVIP